MGVVAAVGAATVADAIDTNRGWSDTDRHGNPVRD
jgi:hypothetical protein